MVLTLGLAVAVFRCYLALVLAVGSYSAFASSSTNQKPADLFEQPKGPGTFVLSCLESQSGTALRDSVSLKLLLDLVNAKLN